MRNVVVIETTAICKQCSTTRRWQGDYERSNGVCYNCRDKNLAKQPTVVIGSHSYRSSVVKDDRVPCTGKPSRMYKAFVGLLFTVVVYVVVAGIIFVGATSIVAVGDVVRRFHWTMVNE